MKFIDVLEYILPVGSIKLAPNATLTPDTESGSYSVGVVANRPMYSYNQLCKMRFSNEFVQDLPNVLNSLYKVRSEPIEDKEIQEWQEVSNCLNSLNFDEARKHVVFENKEMPYVDFGCYEEESVGAYENV